MKKQLVYPGLFVFILLLGSVLRLPDLGGRPMHTDEAVNGMKFGLLLEEGIYKYDRAEYHGPVLPYMTLPVALAKGERTLNDVSESTLRLVPVIFSLSTLLLLLLLVPCLGWRIVLAASLLSAISVPLVYYSRYYIHETLLLCFTVGLIAGIIRYLFSGQPSWLVLSGIFLGMMVSTKETWIIHLAVLAVSVSLSYFYSRRTGGIPPGFRSLSLKGLLFLFLPAVSIWLLFYSSFFSDPTGLKESLLAYPAYYSRAGGDPDHLHPFFYYLRLLAFSRAEGGMWWSGIWITAGAATGVFLIFRKRYPPSPVHGISVLVAIFGILLALVYSLIPYKTPWLLVQFHFTGLLLCAVGLTGLYDRIRTGWAKVTGVTAIAILAGFTLWQSGESAGPYGTHPANPCVYAHPTADVIAISDTVHLLSNRFREEGLFTEVVFRDHEYWPLPWYLRDLERVGYWGTPDLSAPAGWVVLADTSAERALLRKWYEIPPPGNRSLYVPLFDSVMEIRHGVEIRGYIRHDLARRAERGF